MEIDVHCKLTNFRKFMIISTCQSFIPLDFLKDERIFPERPNKHGTMYVEAEDKFTVKRIKEITFVQVSNILGIIYISKSGNTRLKWRSISNGVGRLTGNSSTHALINLFASSTLDESYVNIFKT